MTTRLVDFEGLPEKFTGSNAKISAEAWCRKFMRIIKLKSWPEEQTLDVFKAWLDLDAEEWMAEQEDEELCQKNWSLKDWMTALKKQFPEAPSITKKKMLTTKALEDLSFNEGESIFEFNRRFNSLLYRIPEEWYTDALIKRIYFNAMIKINENLAWTLMEAPNFPALTAVELMKEFQKKYEKREIFYQNVEDSNIKENKTSNVTKDLKKDEVSDITNMLRELTLLIKSKERKPEDKSYLHCFNCDGKGHRTRECSKPRNEELYKKLSTEYFKKKSESAENNQTLLLTTADPVDKVLSTGNKRMRLGHIIDTQTPRYEVGHTHSSRNENNTKPKKKREKKRPNLSSNTVPVRILDSNAPITNRELFKVYPRALDDTIQELKSFKNHKSSKVLVSKELNQTPSENQSNNLNFNQSVPINREKPKPVSYIIGKILTNTTYFFIDVGSTSCVISSEVVKSLGIGYEVISSRITAVGGDTIEVIGNILIPLTFEGNTIVTQFQVLKFCAVPILLGIDFCQLVKAKINYSNQSFNFTINNQQISLQLYSRKSAQEQTEKLDDENSELDSDSDSSYSGSGSSSDEEKILLSLERKEMRENLTDPVDDETSLPYSYNESITDLIDSKINETDLNVVNKKRLKDLLTEYRNIFPSSNLEMKGINNSDYDLHIDPIHPPSFARLRKYAPKEKEIIQEEVNKMLENKVITPSISPWAFPVIPCQEKNSLVL
ncbi:hypothetical protein AYI69_g7842 [Smittium culicis]|uniref:CCHC-type domain-containing protein n=1 Tax=Smittium culicis TaxID=133412 RepID=A0A1R1XP49_9FUNG|nr:hypothetical protein AYI69_g7842 [Smittium culicis]